MELCIDPCVSFCLLSSLPYGVGYCFAVCLTSRLRDRVRPPGVRDCSLARVVLCTPCTQIQLTNEVECRLAHDMAPVWTSCGEDCKEMLAPEVMRMTHDKMGPQ